MPQCGMSAPPPKEKEWFPYTYANWWKLGHTMSDEEVRAFLCDLRAYAITVYAGFNLSQ